MRENDDASLHFYLIVGGIYLDTLSLDAAQIVVIVFGVPFHQTARSQLQEYGTSLIGCLLARSNRSLSRSCLCAQTCMRACNCK